MKGHLTTFKLLIFILVTSSLIFIAKGELNDANATNQASEKDNIKENIKSININKKNRQNEISNIFPEKKYRSLQDSDNKITLTFDIPEDVEDGNIKIFYTFHAIGGSDVYDKIKEIYLNGEETNDYYISTDDYLVIPKVFFGQGENIVVINFVSYIEPRQMFYVIPYLTSADLSEFSIDPNSPSISDSSSRLILFLECSQLTSVNLANFIKSYFTNIAKFFLDCTSLKYVDFTNCDFSGATSVDEIFTNCQSMTILDLPNFNPVHIFEVFEEINFSSFFREMRIVYINWQNFDFVSSNVEHSVTINFSDQQSLKYLNIYNYNPASKVHFVFGDDKTITICMGSSVFESLQNDNDDRIFGEDWTIINNCLDPCFVDGICEYCYRSCDTCEEIGSDEDNKCQECKAGFYKKSGDDFGNNCYQGLEEQGYFLLEGDEPIYEQCYSSCKKCENDYDCTECNDGYYSIYEDYSDYSPEDIPNHFDCYTVEEIKETGCYANYYLNYTEKMFRLCHENCATCSREGTDENNHCDRCFDGYTKENDESGNCYDSSESFEGYYFDGDNGIFKQCYSTCKTCNAGGTEEEHNCNECKEDFTSIEDGNHDNNCYEICPNDQYYFDENGHYKCTIQNEEAENNIEVREETIESSKSSIIENFDSLIVGKNPEIAYMMRGEDYSIVISPMNAVIPESTVNIDFTNCYNKVKQSNPDEEYRVVQMNIKSNDANSLVDSVQYKVYDSNSEEVDLSHCYDVKIEITYKVQNTESLNLELFSTFSDMGVDIFNIHDAFFNDICLPYSDNGTDSDMVLSDRVKDIYQNVSFCEEGCDYNGFDEVTLLVKCDCPIKRTEITGEPSKPGFESYLLSAFFDSNFGVVKCYKLVFGIKGKLNNGGFWLFLCFIILHIPCIIFYFLNGILPITSNLVTEMKNKGNI